MIEDGTQLIYDKITTSYDVNLPPDYYLKYIQAQKPPEEVKWFIRPHHLESLTNHYNSVKDDILNTRYFSHYNMDHGKKPDITNNENALYYIERHVEQLKMKSTTLSYARGEGDPQDAIDDLKQDAKLKKKANEDYEKFIRQKDNRPDPNKLCVQAYESILTHERREERAQLNAQRFKEYEKNRPPADQWYELKTTEFSKELYRNRVALKPDNQNTQYLTTLQDPYLY